MTRKILIVLLVMLMIITSAMAENEETILIIGDSLTYGEEYANTLRNRLTDNKKVVSFGQGSIDSLNMIAIQGGIQLFVEPFDIPQDRRSSEVKLYTNIDTHSVGWLGLKSTQGLNPVSIDGVRGDITVSFDENYKNVHYFFTRAEEGEKHSISRPTVVHTDIMNHYRDSILVIWLGANDTSGYNNTLADAEKMATELYYYIMKAVSYNGNDKYIVLGLTVDPPTLVDGVNKYLAKMFGYHFIDLKRYLVEYGLSDAGIIPTHKDLKSLSEGSVPFSLMQDDMVHFLDIGYEVIGNLLYEKGVENNYWK